jgi:hypothetical protein
MLACTGIGFSLLGTGVWILARFWMKYPVAVNPDTLQEFLQHRHNAAQRDGKRLLGRFFPTDEGSSAPAVERCALLTDMDNLHEGALARSLARKCTAAAAVWWLGSVGVGAYRLDLAPGFGAVLIGGLALTTAAAIFHAPLSTIADVIAFHIASESGAHRRRIEWLQVVGAWGYLVTNSLLPFAFLASVAMMMFFPTFTDGLFETLILMSFVLPFTILPGLLVLALAAAIFARGLVDPRLALRRVSLWTLLGLAIAFVFVLVERVVALQLVRWLALPAESGGAHWGEYVEVRSTDIYGQTVYIASRLADAAAPGEILVSNAFPKALGAHEPAPAPAGARRFKNVPESVECLRLALTPGLHAQRK